MKELNKYILEKLKIDKDTSIERSDYNTVISLITGICNIDLEKKENKDLIDEIENWVKENDIESFKDNLNVCVNLFNFKRICPWYDKLEKNDYVKLLLDNGDLINTQLDKIYHDNIKPKICRNNKELYIYDKFLIYFVENLPYGMFGIAFVKKKN